MHTSLAVGRDSFLLDLYRARHVVFVGFSHNDTILTYLARGLFAATHRYALIREDDRERFRELGIRPIVFPSAHGDDPYESLTEAAEEWANQTARGWAEHEERIRELTSLPPPQTQPDLDYARSVAAAEASTA